ncbi:hypothetical protein BJX76DRAFT_362489 [Aspergillus varians]
MPASFHTYAITPFIQGLQSLKHVLKKAEEHAKANNIPLDDLVNARLIDDMNPLAFQVFVVANTSSKALSRATFVETPTQPQPDKTFDDFYKRIDEVLAEFEKADLAVIAANEGKTFKAELGPREFEATPETYVLAFAIPNFFFHVVAAYAILRAKGVPVGKMDYLGPFVAPIIGA